jgi:transposase
MEGNRRFVEGVNVAGRNRGRWRALPGEYGKWSSVHKRFKRWADEGVWQMIFNTLVEDTDMEWVMIDSTIVRVHQHAAGAKKSPNEALGRSCGGFSTKIMRHAMRWVSLYSISFTRRGSIRLYPSALAFRGHKSHSYSKSY